MLTVAPTGIPGEELNVIDITPPLALPAVTKFVGSVMDGIPVNGFIQPKTLPLSSGALVPESVGSVPEELKATGRLLTSQCCCGLVSVTLEPLTFPAVKVFPAM